MMERHEDASSLYPQELQLRLYQAFIFSIPILFSIILFLLFYLLYLKRRATHMSSQNTRLHRSTDTTTHSVSYISSPSWSVGMKGEVKDKLEVVQFDEELFKASDSQCCVCLGEYEMKEELRQLPLCKHVFHGDCIRHWLRANATCPLCRCPLISALKMGHPIGLVPNTAHQVNNNSSVDMHNQSQEHVVHISGDPLASSNND